MKNIYCFLLTLAIISMIGCASKSSNQVTGNAVLDVESLIEEPEQPEQEEPEQPECGANSYYYAPAGGCVCEEGYIEAEDGCEPEQEEECIKDEDCSPSGDVARDCADIYTAKIYKCDLETNKCIPKKGKAESFDSCRKYSDHLCADGYCVE